MPRWSVYAWYDDRKLEGENLVLLQERGEMRTVYLYSNRRLVENIKHDGNLSSLPFCWRNADGRLVALRGNHRVDAAKDAGIAQIPVLYTDAGLSQSEQIAVQLAHNAVVGADNKQVLRELGEEILEMEFKQYSGLDESPLETVDASALDRLRV